MFLERHADASGSYAIQRLANSSRTAPGPTHAPTASCAPSKSSVRPGRIAVMSGPRTCWSNPMMRPAHFSHASGVRPASRSFPLPSGCSENGPTCRPSTRNTQTQKFTPTCKSSAKIQPLASVRTAGPHSVSVGAASLRTCSLRDRRGSITTPAICEGVTRSIASSRLLASWPDSPRKYNEPRCAEQDHEWNERVRCIPPKARRRCESGSMPDCKGTGDRESDPKNDCGSDDQN